MVFVPYRLFNIKIFKGFYFLTNIVSVTRKYTEMISLQNLMLFSSSLEGGCQSDLPDLGQEYNLYS